MLGETSSSPTIYSKQGWLKAVNSPKGLSATFQVIHATHTSSFGFKGIIGHCFKDLAEDGGHLNYLFLHPLSYSSHHRKLTGLVTVCLTKCTDCSSLSCPSWVWTQLLGWFACSCPVCLVGVVHLDTKVCPDYRSRPYIHVGQQRIHCPAPSYTDHAQTVPKKLENMIFFFIYSFIFFPP